LSTKLGFLESLGIQFNGLTNATELPVAYVACGISFLLLIAWFTPNTQEWMGQYNPIALKQPGDNATLNWRDRLWHKLQWQPNQIWAVVGVITTAISLLSLTRVSEFLYFQF
jgi:hypothetical protein